MTFRRESGVPYLQALLAGITSVLFVAVYLVVDKLAADGWLRDFLLAFLPGAAVISSAYAILYLLFSRRGLTREQQVADAVAEKVAGRLSHAAAVEAVSSGAEEPEWSRYLAEADRLEVAARSLARWSSSVDDALRAFFEGGGTLRVFAHDPRDEANLRVAAAGRSGYLDDDPGRVRSNVVIGLSRLARAAARHPGGRAQALEVRLIQPAAFVFPTSLFVFSRHATMQRIILRPHQLVRREVTSGPLFVLDPGRDPTLREHYTEELERLTAISTAVADGELDGLLAQPNAD